MKANYLILFLLFFLSCKNTKHTEEKFDKNKWAIKVDQDYPYRNNMLHDLMTNHELHGLKKDQVIELLGEPTRSDTFYLFYRISQEHLGAIPIHTKTLVIKLKSDSTVEWRKVHE